MRKYLIVKYIEFINIKKMLIPLSSNLNITTFLNTALHSDMAFILVNNIV